MTKVEGGTVKFNKSLARKPLNEAIVSGVGDDYGLRERGEERERVDSTLSQHQR